jgi:hypothetical protein
VLDVSLASNGAHSTVKADELLISIAMTALDSDNKLLELGGRRAVRDIVQFVP